MDELQAFLVVATTLSFGRAAARLHSSQPTVSRQIARLEHTVGVPLFWRNSRRVRVSDAGAVFLPYAQDIIYSAERGVRAARLAAGLESPARARQHQAGAGTRAASCTRAPGRPCTCIHRRCAAL